MVKVDRRIRWHYTTTILRLRIGARLTAHFYRCTLALSAGTLMASGGTPYRLVPAQTRTEQFSGPCENCQRNVTDLAGSPVTSSRSPGRLQKRPDDRTSNAGVAVRTADGSRRTADAEARR